jgi:hypothetical protein
MSQPSDEVSTNDSMLTHLLAPMFQSSFALAGPRKAISQPAHRHDPLPHLPTPYILPKASIALACAVSSKTARSLLPYTMISPI